MKSTDLDTDHQRIYSRILEMCVPIYCGGEDSRGIKKRNSEFALEQVYNVIDSRYCKMLPLIVTTNLGLNEMKSTDLDTAHQRIYSRILEMCVPIYCGGEDKRKEEGTEKLVQVQNLITG